MKVNNTMVKLDENMKIILKLGRVQSTKSLGMEENIE